MGERFSGITTSHLASMTVPAGTSYQFTYDTAGAAELNQANYPDGGHIRWVYGTMQYSSNRMLREIGSRYVAAGATGGTEWGAYTFSHNDTGNPNPTIHANTTLVDASGIGAKTWNFILPDGNQSDAWKVGMLSEFVQKASASGAVLSDQTNTWAQSTAAQPYVSGSATVLDGGSSNPKTTTSSYTVDQYGNGTQQKVYDYSGALVRTYTNTYLTSATWDGEGCTSAGVGVFSSNGASVNGSSSIWTTSQDLLSAYNAYAGSQQTLFAANYLNWYYDPARQQAQLATQAGAVQSGLETLLKQQGVPQTVIDVLSGSLVGGSTVGGHFNLTISVNDLTVILGADLADYLTTGFPNGNRAGGFWNMFNSLHSEIDPDDPSQVDFHIDTFNAGAFIPIGFLGHVGVDVIGGTIKQGGTRGSTSCIDRGCP